MSYFDDASLVFIPSGTKTSKAYSVKPIDGTGDLTFTRSNDTASRVASNGLIERVRTNLLLQSNTFSTTWAITASTTVTSGQAGYDGTNNAWLLKRSDTSARNISQNITQAASVYTFSVYAKAETVNWVYLYSSDGTNTSTAYFDLATGALGTTSGAITSKIESVGNGWYRCSVSYSDDITTVRIYPAVANGSITGGVSPAGVYIQDAQLETGDIATQPILTTSAAVSTGPVANTPRLDYLNSSCPRLNLEPQRSNLIQFSEIFDNAWWAKSNSTISANAVTSPDGYTNADNLVENTSNSTHGVGNLSGLTLTAAPYTFSVFVKKQNRNFFAISTFDGSTTLEGYFNINTGAVATMPAGLTGAITNYGNGWYRCSVTRTMGANSNNFFAFNSSITDGGSTYTGTGVVACSIYGGSLELGSYATSYIPTLGSASTRAADAASKTGISSLIGQTEGTLFCEVSFKTNDAGTYLSIEDWANLELVRVYSDATTLNAQIYSGSNVFLAYTSYNAVVGQSYKMALAYSASGAAFYVNGVSAGQVATSLSIPTCSNVRLAAFTSGQEMNADIKQALLFKTRLTNAQLAELTSL